MFWDVTFNPQVEEANFWRELVEIAGYRNFVTNVPLTPGMRREIDTLNIVRAIAGTTGIEGNTLAESRIAEIVESEPGTEEVENVEEVEALNAKRVLFFIRANQPQRQAYITEDLIKTIHRLTTENCNYPNNEPGAYRLHNPHAGDYDCPRREEMPRRIVDFIEFINQRGIIDLHPAIRAVLAHFYLVSIHPFGDGNGRTARGIEAFILFNGGYYNALGFYSLANFFYRSRARYIQELQDARFKHGGRLSAFVHFALEGFVEELESIHEQVLDFYRVLSFRDFLREAQSERSINKRIYNLVRNLVKSRRKISLVAFKTRDDELVAALWADRADRVLLRDLKTMKDQGLVFVDANGDMSANIKLMDSFSAVAPLDGL